MPVTSAASAPAGSRLPVGLLVVLAAGVILALRLAALDLYPAIAADEGGWPLSVRLWATTGVITPDFHNAPIYHLVLGTVFKMFGATLLVGRVWSAVLGLLTLGLFYWWCRQQLSPRAAVWATLLLGVSFPAVEISRRALIEPLQVLWMVALVGAFGSRARRAWVGVAIATALLLLTKANAVFLLMSLVLVAVARRRPVDGDRDFGPKMAALAGGSVAAGAVFAFLWWLDPVGFQSGWGSTMSLDMIQGAPVWARVGRFAFSPEGIADSLRFLSGEAPFLLVLGAIAIAQSLSQGRRDVAALWVLLGLPFLLSQVWHPAQYFAVLYPPLAWLAADGLDRAFQRDRAAGARERWPAFIVAIAVLYSVLRLGGGLLTVREPTRAATAWLQDHAAPGDVIAGPAYVLMRFGDITPVPLHGLGPSYVPDATALDSLDWIVVDEREWRGLLARLGRTDALTHAMTACCESVYHDDAATIYRPLPAH